MKRKITSIIGGLLITALLAGCGGNSSSGNSSNSGENSGEWTFDRKIEIVCPWGIGGGADTTLRAFAAQLEKEIGQPVTINNKSGAGGIVGVEYAMSQPEDGYIWLLNTPSTMLAQITGATDLDVYGNITPVCQLVHDTNVLVTSKDSPFNTYEELMAYVEANPGTVKCGVMTITGLDAACVQTTFGDKIESVAYSEGAQLSADVIGNHVSLACVGPAEVMGMIQSGDMKPVLVFSENRLTMDGFENAECTGELGIDSYFGPYRGIFAKNGTPEEAMKAFEAAAEKAVNSEEFQTWAASQGLDQRQGWKNTADFKSTWEESYKDLTELFGN